MRRALLLGAVVACSALAAAPAGATNECRGLMVCVPITGPWVVATPGQVEFQLSCPPRFVVGGLDAQLSTRGLDVTFVGALGSPVNPGITTSKDAVFLGRLVRGRDPAPSFRPLIGCVPASGGGRRTPTAYAPGKPTVRRSSIVDVVPAATRTFTGRCTRGERAVSATHAVAFFGDTPPTAALARAVTVTQTVLADRVRLKIRATGAVAETRAVVQLNIVCGGAR